MITIWIQEFVGYVMLTGVAPIIKRGVARAMPNLPPGQLESVMDQLFNPACATGGRLASAPGRTALPAESPKA